MNRRIKKKKKTFFDVDLIRKFETFGFGFATFLTKKDRIVFGDKAMEKGSALVVTRMMGGG